MSDQIKPLDNFFLLNYSIVKFDFSSDFAEYKAEDPEITRKFNVNNEIVDVSKKEDGFYATIIVNMNLSIQSDHQNLFLNSSIIGSFYSDQMEQEEFKHTFKTFGCSSLYELLKSTTHNFLSQAVPGDRIILPFIKFQE